jgi:hypothetical protein
MTFNWGSGGGSWARKAEKKYSLPKGTLGTYNTPENHPGKAPALHQYLVSRAMLEDMYEESKSWGEASPFGDQAADIGAGWYTGWPSVKIAARGKQKIIDAQKKAAAGEELTGAEAKALEHWETLGTRKTEKTKNPKTGEMEWKDFSSNTSGRGCVCRRRA